MLFCSTFGGSSLFRYIDIKEGCPYLELLQKSIAALMKCFFTWKPLLLSAGPYSNQSYLPRPQPRSSLGLHNTALHAALCSAVQRAVQYLSGTYTVFSTLNLFHPSPTGPGPFDILTLEGNGRKWKWMGMVMELALYDTCFTKMEFYPSRSAPNSISPRCLLVSKVAHPTRIKLLDSSCTF